MALHHTFFAQLDGAIKRGLKSFYCNVNPSLFVLVNVVAYWHHGADALFMYTTEISLSEESQGSLDRIGVDQMLSTPAPVNIIYTDGTYYVKQNFLSMLKKKGKETPVHDLTIINYEALKKQKQDEIRELIEVDIWNHEGVAKSIYAASENEYPDCRQDDFSDAVRDVMFDITSRKTKSGEWTPHPDIRSRNALANYVHPFELTNGMFIDLLTKALPEQSIADDFIYDNRIDLAKYFRFEKAYDRLLSSPIFLDEREKKFVKCLNAFNHNEAVVIKLKDMDKPIQADIADMALSFAHKRSHNVIDNETHKLVSFALNDIELIKRRGSVVFPYAQTTIYTDTD